MGGPLGDSYHGPSPRHQVSKAVYTASEVPSALVIPEHAEMSYLPRMTRHLFFWCQQPATTGGATTFVDARRVLDHLDPIPSQQNRTRVSRGLDRTRVGRVDQSMVRLLTEPVRIRRRHAARAAHLDPFELKPWPAMFGTEDRDEAIERAYDLGFTARFDWSGALTLESEQATVRVHPESGERAWLNHLLVFHASAPAALFASAFRHERKLGALAGFPLAVGYRRWSARLGREVPADVRHADGSAIADDVVASVRAVVDALAVPLVWRGGDLVIVDNHMALHGRRPFSGPRRLAVAFSAAFA